MSKARTLANLISDNAELADGQISVAEVVGAAPLASPSFTGTASGTFSGPLTGNVIGNLTGNLTGNVNTTLIASPTLNATVNIKTTDANGEGIGLGIDADKKVRFYDDQGASTKMYWNASTATQKFEDSSKIAFGSSEDLKIYHSQITGNNIDLSSSPLQIKQLGANSVTQFHKNSTGHGPLLQFFNNGASHGSINTDNNQFILSADGELLIRSGGGSLKLATTSTGIDVTGTVSSDGLSVDGTITADNFTNVDLTAIAKDISDTAVDVFVYDTSKDSDGGAWRKRTQHTSWYNEAASSTRGSRKEFPAVAVIVAESGTVTIYDGDDPDLPMWMVFNVLNINGSSVSSSVFMTNGDLYIGRNIGVYRANLLSDKISTFTIYGEIPLKYQTDISLRSEASNGTTPDASRAIVNNTINDVAMTVLPNAPIDDATGLPVPTIAVATNGGVSVIKDDGTVVDLTYTANATNESGSVNFTEGNGVAWTTRNISGTYAYLQHLHTIPSSDYSSAPDNIYYRDVNAVPGYIGTYISKLLSIPNGYAVSSTAALTIFDENKDLTSTGMNAYITSDYNTGWMNGDIKLATLSDTNDTNVTGSELVTNGTFDSGTDWITESGWTISSGVATASSAGHGAGLVQIGASFVAGVTYVVTFTVSNYTTGSLTLYAPRTPTFYRPFLGAFGSNGTHTFTFTPTVSSSDIRFEASGTTSLSIDNISIRKAEEDRSVNGNGLQVFGSITKNPVATGADLVSYSGFNTNNKLIQPYNSDLDFGTGDFFLVAWVKQASFTTNHYFVDRYSASGRYGFYVNTYNDLIVFTQSGTTASETSVNVPEGVWTCLGYARRNGVVYFYIDGIETSSTAFTDNMTIAGNPQTWVGNWNQGLELCFDNLALLRMSATAPSAEQIAKIYNDEKHLFQENAKATLYGTSDAVTALAHDDTTDLLHVGTNAGRSVFQGLRRVDNTTDAVGAAISASNGLVAED